MNCSKYQLMNRMINSSFVQWLKMRIKNPPFAQWLKVRIKNSPFAQWLAKELGRAFIIIVLPAYILYCCLIKVTFLQFSTGFCYIINAAFFFKTLLSDATSRIEHTAPPKRGEEKKVFFFKKTLPFAYIIATNYYIFKCISHISHISILSKTLASQIYQGAPLINIDIPYVNIISNPFRLVSMSTSLILIAFIVNCSRSYYMIHELDNGSFRNIKNSGTFVNSMDWILRLIIAIVFIVLAKELTEAGRVAAEIVEHGVGGSVSSHPSYAKVLSRIASNGERLYILLLLWSAINYITGIHPMDAKRRQLCVPILGILLSFFFFIASPYIGPNNTAIPSKTIFFIVLFMTLILAICLIVLISSFLVSPEQLEKAEAEQKKG